MRVKLKIFFIILLVIFLSQVNAAAAGIYLGSLNALQDDHFVFSLPIKSDRNFNELAIKVEKNYFTADGGRISSQNLFVVTRDAVIPLSKSFININERDLLDFNELTFKLRLQSTYSPGLYRNNLIIKTERGEERLKIDFEIPAIMKLSAAGDLNPSIKYSKNHFSEQIYSSGQSKLLIKANKNWILKAVNEGGENLEIKLKEFKGNGSVSSSRDEFIKIGKEAVIIAQGNKTTNLAGGNAELIYLLKITDYKKIHAGQKDYQLRFFIE